MGRNRSFDEGDVVTRAAEAFLRTGYEGTSVDDLVRATGVHRGSLYNAFGSKRGLFLTALRHVMSPGAGSPAGLDLLLVATLELAPRDAGVRTIVKGALERISDTDPAGVLGRRLLERAHLDTDTPPSHSAKEKR